jgi:protein SCO1/2
MMAMLPPVSMRRRVLGVAAALLVAAGCGDKGSSASAPKTSFQSTDITGVAYARQLELPDAEGKLRSLSEFRGKVVVVFFGYTQCPDVCPTTMAELSQVRRALGPDGSKLQVLFVTVDPERDSAAVLKAYAENFGAGFIGLRGNAEQTKAAAREFKVFFEKAPGKTESTYTVDHSAAAFIFDTQGRVRLYSRYGAGPKALEQDIRTLLHEAP